MKIEKGNAIEAVNKFNPNFYSDFNRRSKDTRIHIISWYNRVLNNNHGGHVIYPDYIWFDINRDEIISNLDTSNKYDVYVITKRGRIKVKRNLTFLRVIASRFKYFKKYIVIARVFISEEKEEIQNNHPDIELMDLNEN